MGKASRRKCHRAIYAEAKQVGADPLAAMLARMEANPENFGPLERFGYNGDKMEVYDEKRGQWMIMPD